MYAVTVPRCPLGLFEMAPWLTNVIAVWTSGGNAADNKALCDQNTVSVAMSDPRMLATFLCFGGRSFASPLWCSLRAPLLGTGSDRGRGAPGGEETAIAEEEATKKSLLRTSGGVVSLA